MTKKMTWSQAIQALNQDYHMREPRPTQPEPVFNGWKLVPVKPTHKMETAIGKSRNLSASEIWEDAITAAPEPSLDYSGLYDYAQANKLNYNELCTVVRTACGIKE